MAKNLSIITRIKPHLTFRTCAPRCTQGQPSTWYTYSLKVKYTDENGCQLISFKCFFYFITNLFQMSLITLQKKIFLNGPKGGKKKADARMHGTIRLSSKFYFHSRKGTT